MKNRPSINILIGLVIAVILFHLTITIKIIPYNIAWGGRLENETEMYVFEVISIIVNLFLTTVLLMKGDYIKLKFNQRTIDIILWVFFSVFILNTIGNILAKTNFEKYFAILTLIFALLIWNILKSKSTNDNM